MIDKKTDETQDTQQTKHDADDFDLSDDFSEHFDGDDDPDPFKEQDKSSSDNLDYSQNSGSLIDSKPNIASKAMDFIKGYGIAIVVIGVFGYFGLKYSTNVIFNKKEGNNTVVLPPVNVADKNTTINKLVGIPKTPDNQALPQTVPQTVASVKPEPALPTADKATSFDALKGVNTKLVDSSIAETSSNKIKESSIAPIAAPLSVGPDELNNLNKEINKLQNALNDMNKQLEERLDNKLKENTADVNQLKQQMQQLLIYVQGVGKAVGILSSTVKRQQDILTTVVDSVVGKAVSKNSGEQGLVLEALIPGRAWFKTKTGKEITVGVGDTLAGYGKVIKIDSDAGAVTMDNGKVLKQ